VSPSSKGVGRPIGSRFDKQVSVPLTRELVDLVDERRTRERTTFAEALRRCLQDYLKSIQPTADDQITVTVSRQDREDLRRLVQNGLVTSEAYAATTAIHEYIASVIAERKERHKVLGTL
jgi:Arc/MetJ-type ribon-helix-helix transcriptional regulator